MLTGKSAYFYNILYIALIITLGACKTTTPVDDSGFSLFTELPITSIQPEGWLKQYLVNQRNGLTGHLDEIGYPFDSETWSAVEQPVSIQEASSAWWPYEQTGYWIDGLVRCGYLLEDTFLINKANRFIDNTMNNPDDDGYLGPQHMKEGKAHDWWAHAVFFRAVLAKFEATGDTTLLNKLIAHYKSSPSYVYDWPLETVNIEILGYVYEHTGDTSMLALAEKIYNEFNELYPAAKPDSVAGWDYFNTEKHHRIPYHLQSYLQMENLPMHMG